MALRQQILDDIKSAMKAKEQIRLSTLRMLQSAVKNKEIEVRPKEISEEDILQVVKKLVKQRKDSIEQYQAAGRQELADKEAEEVLVLETYLPEQLSEGKIIEIIETVISETGASGPKEMGAVMKAVLAKVAGQADGKLVSQIVKSKLQ